MKYKVTIAIAALGLAFLAGMKTQSYAVSPERILSGAAQLGGLSFKNGCFAAGSGLADFLEARTQGQIVLDKISIFRSCEAGAQQYQDSISEVLTIKDLQDGVGNRGAPPAQPEEKDEN